MKGLWNTFRRFNEVVRVRVGWNPRNYSAALPGRVVYSARAPTQLKYDPSKGQEEIMHSTTVIHLACCYSSATHQCLFCKWDNHCRNYLRIFTACSALMIELRHYYNEVNDFSLKIPEGAILRETVYITIDIGVALYGSVLKVSDLSLRCSDSVYIYIPPLTLVWLCMTVSWGSQTWVFSVLTLWSWQ